MSPNEAQLHGAMPRNANVSTASAAPANPTAIAIGVSVGAVVLLALALVTVRVVRARRARRRATAAALEEGTAVPAALKPADTTEVPGPASGCSASLFTKPFNTHGDSDALGSHVPINEPQAPASPGKRKRPASSAPKCAKSRGILKPSQHLSAIIESPRMKQEPARPPALKLITTFDVCGRVAPQHGDVSGDADWYPTPESPQPAVVPSCAFRPPRPPAAGTAHGVHNAKAPRSVSAGVLTDSVSGGAVWGDDEPWPHMGKRRGPLLHLRSFSFGGPPSRPPSGPVPPLPVISPLETDWDEARKGAFVSRMSSSSHNGSTAGSVRVTSPGLGRRDADEPVVSRAAEQVLDGDHGAVKLAGTHTWRDAPAPGPGPTSSMKAGRHARTRSSVGGRMVRSRTDSALVAHLRPTSSSSTSSCGSAGKRLSIPQLGTAERVSLSRVSSSNSLASPGIHKITTPTNRAARRQSSVSANGSPAPRRRASALGDMCGNIVLQITSTTREPSPSPATSGRSSHGHPSHRWATPSSNVLPKPSALKGSPNARRGHRIQKSCVRISTLTPEVLGPARSRPTSPSGLMHEITEERESDGLVRQPGRRDTAMYLARRAKPPRASASPDNLRIQTLRASLTPSSPTLSTCHAYQEPSGLPSPNAQSNPSASPTSSTSRTASRLSDASFTIPKFPSPARTVHAAVSRVAIDTAPMPEFAPASLTADEADETRRSSSPFALDMSRDKPTTTLLAIPSSPPLPFSHAPEYDPARPITTIAPTLPASLEYDPASPPSTTVHGTEADMSSRLFLPFAMGNVHASPESSDPVSPRSRSTPLCGGSREPVTPDDDSAPCSPKTMSISPVDTFMDNDLPALTPRRGEDGRPTPKLPCEKAGTILARSQATAPQLSLGFPGVVPVLAPTTQYDEDQGLPRWSPQRRYVDIDRHEGGGAGKEEDEEGGAEEEDEEDEEEEEEEEEEETTTPRAETSLRLAKAPSLSTIPQSSSSPPPPPPAPSALSIFPSPAAARPPPPTRAGIMGPRAAPAQSCLRNAKALRRMNSEANCARGHTSRPSRTYVRLGREASPELPYLGRGRRGGSGGGDSSSSSSTSSSSHPRHQHFNFDFACAEDATRPTPPPPAPRPGAAAAAAADVDLDALDRQVDRALRGFHAEWAAAAAAAAADHHSNKENTSPTSPARRRRHAEQWCEAHEQARERPGTAHSLFAHHSTPATPTKEAAEPEPEPQPQAAAAAAPHRHTERVMATTTTTTTTTTTPREPRGGWRTPVKAAGPAAATPKSLYDAEGFLRA